MIEQIDNTIAILLNVIANIFILSF